VANSSAEPAAAIYPCAHENVRPTKGLLTHQELAAALGRKPIDPVVHMARWVLRLDEINDIYARCAHLDLESFTDQLFKILNVRLDVNEESLALIPDSGPVVVVANHPLGALDGVGLLGAVLRRRKDVRIMTNYVLQRIEPLREVLIDVDPFNTPTSVSANIGGFRKALHHLNQGGVLVVFPAGEVSSTLVNGLGPVDRPWSETISKIIQRTSAEVVPAFITGRNSSLFYAAGKIHPRLRTALLPSELLRQRNGLMSITFGAPIHRGIIQASSSAQDLGRFLRTIVYLKSPALLKRSADASMPKVVLPAVAGTVSCEAIETEIDQLDSCRLLTQGDFDVFLMQRDTAPNILHEIGRLREITFRHVGEGTGTALDIDAYDRHYEHLVLWHRPSKCIAGSYRLGHGGRIMEKHGISGMYSASLFHFDDTARAMMRSCLELGRSFVRPEFQRQRLPLHLLWRGILTYIISHPELEAIVGCVSVSDRYRDVSKEIIRAFFMRRAATSSLYGHVQPRAPFKADLPGIEIDDLMHPINDDMRLLDKLIAHIEPDGSSCPILLKKYAQQNAQMVAFNVDAAFSNALDGFMVLSLSELSEEIRGLAREQSATTSVVAP
jgi:putative hemolysin